MSGLLTGLLLIGISLPSGQAYPRVLTCSEMFELSFERRFEFAPDLALNSRERVVRWKGQVFHLGDHQFAILEMVLAARELALHDDIITALYGYDGGGDAPEMILKAQLYYIRKAFRQVDPDFDLLHTVKGKGLYWLRSRDQTATVQHGPLFVARHLPLAWWHETFIALQPAEQSILFRLLKRTTKEMSLESLLIDHASINSIRVILSKFNARFEKITGHRLIIASKKGLTGVIRLNPELF